MANRPIFLPVLNLNDQYVKTINIEFKWFSGFAKSQKQKSIKALQEVASTVYNLKKILDISSSSPTEEGVEASAFNLMFYHSQARKFYTVESAFQASKVFENGGPYSDIMDKTSKEAKKDPRVRNSGKLTSFSFFGERWELSPKTAFYDWVYINALNLNKPLSQKLLEYDAFIDIEFNPEKSINCQARSVALFVSLYRQNLLEEALQSRINFLKCYPKTENQDTLLKY